VITSSEKGAAVGLAVGAVVGARLLNANNDALPLVTPDIPTVGKLLLATMEANWASNVPASIAAWSMATRLVAAAEAVIPYTLDVTVAMYSTLTSDDVSTKNWWWDNRNFRLSTTLAAVEEVLLVAVRDKSLEDTSYRTLATAENKASSLAVVDRNVLSLIPVNTCEIDTEKCTDVENVGTGEGIEVGLAVGSSVGVGVGLILMVGWPVEGSAVGFAVDGRTEGTAVGIRVGLVDGPGLGTVEGPVLGVRVGLTVGSDVGLTVGETVGTTVGSGVGITDGVSVGPTLGINVGAGVGGADGAVGYRVSVGS
jgi:hypothetical protein